MSLHFCPQCGLPVENQPWTFCPACGCPLRQPNSSNQPIFRPSVNSEVLRKAYSHFQQAQNYFQQAYDKLRGAKGLSTWDILGGGFIADIMKHSRVDDSRHLVELAVQQLNTGYSLVPLAPKIRLAQVHDNNFVWDVLFDNIFSDWSAREKIVQSLRSVEDAIHDTTEVLHWIQQQLNLS